jgi:hypothetical protein
VCPSRRLTAATTLSTTQGHHLITVKMEKAQCKAFRLQPVNIGENPLSVAFGRVAERESDGIGNSIQRFPNPLP